MRENIVELVSVDDVIMTLDGKSGDKSLHVLLVKRSNLSDDPFPGYWSLPGLIIKSDKDNSADDCAARVLIEKAGLTNAAAHLEQLKTFANGVRDPRGFSVSVSYYALVPFAETPSPTSKRIDEAKWFPVEEALQMALAFDHNEILSVAVERLRAKVGYTMIATRLLPDLFTINELQQVHEDILGMKLDKSSFRKRLKNVDSIEPVTGEMRLGSNRPAQLWRIKEDKPNHLFKRSI